jgi:hypothetical protein
MEKARRRDVKTLLKNSREGEGEGVENQRRKGS